MPVTLSFVFASVMSGPPSRGRVLRRARRYASDEIDRASRLCHDGVPCPSCSSFPPTSSMTASTRARLGETDDRTTVRGRARHRDGRGVLARRRLPTRPTAWCCSIRASRRSAVTCHGVLQSWADRAGAHDRVHPWPRRPRRGSLRSWVRPMRARAATPDRHRARERAAAVRSLRPHHRLQRDHQRCASSGAVGRPRTATADAVAAQLGAAVASPTTTGCASMSVGSTSSCATIGARPTTTPGPGSRAPRDRHRRLPHLGLPQRRQPAEGAALSRSSGRTRCARWPRSSRSCCCPRTACRSRAAAHRRRARRRGERARALVAQTLQAHERRGAARPDHPRGRGRPAADATPLPPGGVRRTRVRDPQHLASLRGLVRRQSCASQAGA